MQLFGYAVIPLYITAELQNRKTAELQNRKTAKP